MTALILPLALVGGCVTEGDEPTGDESEPDVSTTESALCNAYNSPPAADWTHNFGTTTQTVYRTASGYGTSACANYVVKIELGGSPSYANGALRVAFKDPLPTNAYACVATSLTVRVYNLEWPDGGPQVTTTTHHGEWTANGCVISAHNVYTAWQSPTVEMSAQRAMYCPNGGPYCAAAVYGLPISLEAYHY